MSLFIGTLAFAGPEQAAQVRIGALGGSLISALCGYLFLRAVLGKSVDRMGADQDWH